MVLDIFEVIKFGNFILSVFNGVLYFKYHAEAYQNMRSVLIYTAIFGDYDHPKFSSLVKMCNEVQIDFAVINDQNYSTFVNDFGIKINLDLMSPIEKNRLFKFSTHQKYDYSIYVDGNISFSQKDILKLLDDFVSSHANVGFGTHTEHSTLREELTKCWILGKINRGKYRDISKYLASNRAFSLKPFHNSVVLKKRSECLFLKEHFFRHYLEMKIPRDQFIIPVLYRDKQNEVFEFEHKKYNLITLRHNTTVSFKIMKRIRMIWRNMYLIMQW